MSEQAPTNKPSYRFPQRLRLKSPEQFQAIYALKKTAADERLLLFAAWNGLPHPRLGVSVSRKIGNAVVRNRFKRLFREAFRLTQHEMPPGVDFIMIPRGSATEPSLAEMQESLKTLAAQVVRRLPKPTPTAPTPTPTPTAPTPTAPTPTPTPTPTAATPTPTPTPMAPTPTPPKPPKPEASA